MSTSPCSIVCKKHSIYSTLRKPLASGQWHLRDLVVCLNASIWIQLACFMGTNPWDSSGSQPHGPFARLFPCKFCLPVCHSNAKQMKDFSETLRSTLLWEGIGCGNSSFDADNPDVARCFSNFLSFHATGGWHPRHLRKFSPGWCLVCMWHGRIRTRGCSS